LSRLCQAVSPAVAAAARAGVAQMDELAGQFLQARRMAYGAVAALGAMETALPLEADCDYLVARGLTRKVNALAATGEAVPWRGLEFLRRGRNLRRCRSDLRIARIAAGRRIALDQVGRDALGHARNALRKYRLAFAWQLFLGTKKVDVKPPGRIERIADAGAAAERQRER
jgi:hypothetical protein